MGTRGWPLSAVTLKVLRLEPEKAFWRQLGLVEMPAGDLAARFGVSGRVLVGLRGLGGRGRPRLPQTAGLYRLGLRLENEAELGSFLWRALDGGLRWESSSDHGLYSSFYFTSPDGLGVEVYADKANALAQGVPPDLYNRQVDHDELLGLGTRGQALGVNSVVGHLHLNVADLGKSAKFYGKLGMKPAGFREDARWRYLSWGGYHHHLAVNLLEGRGALPVSGEESGLEGFESNQVRQVMRDPDGIQVRPGV